MRESRYVPLTQQPYCCVAACIQMVLLRRKLPLLSQEEIAYELGLIVPRRYKKLLPMARTGKRPAAGWGTQENKYTINRFFNKYRIPLKKSNFPIAKIKDDREWIADQIKQDNDVLVCFDYGDLYGGKGQGHVCIIDSISDSKVTLVDPEYDVPKYRTVELDRLITAVRHHKGENKGFWAIAQTA